MHEKSVFLSKDDLERIHKRTHILSEEELKEKELSEKALKEKLMVRLQVNLNLIQLLLLVFSPNIFHSHIIFSPNS